MADDINLFDLDGDDDDQSLEESEVRPQKAYIVVLENCVVPSVNIRFSNNEKIELQLNPSDYSISSPSNFKPETAGIQQDNGTFGFHMEETRPVLSVKMLFDAQLGKKQASTLSAIKSKLSGIGGNSLTNLAKLSNKFTSDMEDKYLVKLKALTHSIENGKRPPQVAFVYGQTNFRGFVSNLEVQYKAFASDGSVTRAEVDIKITYAPDYIMTKLDIMADESSIVSKIAAVADVVADEALTS